MYREMDDLTDDDIFDIQLNNNLFVKINNDKLDVDLSLIKVNEEIEWAYTEPEEE